MNLTKNFASRRQSWRDSRQDRAEIFATVNLLLSGNLGEIRGSIFPARFWPPGLLLPGENLGEIRGRIAPRVWPPGFFLLGENLGEICGRIPARFWLTGILLPGENLGEICSRIAPRFWPPGFLLLGENLGEFRVRIPARFWPAGNLAGIPARLLPGRKIPVAKISPRIPAGFPPRSQWDPAKILVLILQGQMLSDTTAINLMVLSSQWHIGHLKSFTCNHLVHLAVHLKVTLCTNYFM